MQDVLQRYVVTPTAQAKPANDDLNKVQIEQARDQVRIEAAEIVKACDAAGVPHLAGEFIAKGTPVAEVHQYFIREGWRAAIRKVEGA